eukprot:6142065-Prymnesium_polylepis.1
MRRAVGMVELVGHIDHRVRVPVIRILRVAHPLAHLQPMCTAAELSRTANATLHLRPKDADADGTAQLRDE